MTHWQIACDELGSEAIRRCFGECQANESRQRGTVGSLFRWSTAPADGELPQPDEPLVTDRPDFTEASSVVGLGVLQIESGYTYTRDVEGNRTTRGETYPEVLARLGVFANWLEARVGWTYADGSVSDVAFPSSPATGSGAEDMYLGLKLGLTPQLDWRPEMAIVPQMTVPTGSGRTTAGRVLSGCNWLYSWELSDLLSTAGSTQYNQALDDQSDRLYMEWAQSWTLGYSLTERLGGYTEYFGLYPSGADTVRPQHYFNGGLTYLITNDFQWDVRAGTGLNSVADDFFVGSGFAYRFR